MRSIINAKYHIGKAHSEENSKLQNELKGLEKILENLKKEIEQKDFVLKAKENTIEQLNYSRARKET